MSVKSATRAATETAGHGLRFLALSVLALIVFSAQSRYQQWRQATAEIYTAPSDVVWSLRPGALVVSGVSEKKEDCDVIFDSPVFLLAFADHDGALEPMAYPAIKMSGRELQGRPLLRVGDRFVVGPWVIRDSQDMLQRISEVRMILQCQFSSGLRRSTYIGPLKRPEK